MSLIDVELKSITAEIPMEKRLRKKLSNRFISRSFDAKVQLELLQYLNDEIVKYASFKKKRSPAISLTNSMLFVLVRLMGDLYNTEDP